MPSPVLPRVAPTSLPPVAYHPALRYWRPAPEQPQELAVDVGIYGGVAAGVVAAVQCAQLGLSVALLEPGQQLGGMTAGGLSMTDTGKKAAIGGASRGFYERLGRHYGVPIEWRFEPKVAAATLAAMLAEVGVTPHLGQYLARVELDRPGGALRALHTTSGLTVTAKVWLDCTYEGDLLAAAGVSYTIGRESNATYGETCNGQQVHRSHQFLHAVSPYVVAGDATSGLLPGIEPGEPEIGVGDHRVQAYNFRMCLTRHPGNRLPFPQPLGYDRATYTLLERVLQAGWREVFTKFDAIRGDKTDTNNHGPFSTDCIGASHRWPEATYAEREALFQEHVRYQMGLQWFLANDAAVPTEVQQAYRAWGLARDEFTATGHWPHQLYIREGRRMVSDVVMTELNCQSQHTVPHSIGLAAYWMDSHNCRRFARDGRVLNEGDVQVPVAAPYPVGYGSIVPRRGECPNLFVPVCLSSSHIAYGSIRMEPVFMILAQSAALAASIALQRGCPVQDVPYAELQPRLVAAGQRLAWQG